jgi:hypothetical protein
LVVIGAPHPEEDFMPRISLCLLLGLAAVVVSCRTKGPVDPGQPPAAPTGLSVILREPTRITLRWTAGDSTQTGFHLFVRPDSGTTWALRANVTADTRTETLGSLAASTRYWFRVTAYNAGGASPASNEVLDSTLASTDPIVGSWIASAAALTILNLQSSNYLLATNNTYQWLYRSSSGTQGQEAGTYLTRNDTLFFTHGTPGTTYSYYYQLTSANDVLKLRTPSGSSSPDLIYNRRQ